MKRGPEHSFLNFFCSTKDGRPFRREPPLRGRRMLKLRGVFILCPKLIIVFLFKILQRPSGSGSSFDLYKLTALPPRAYTDSALLPLLCVSRGVPKIFVIAALRFSCSLESPRAVCRTIVSVSYYFRAL